MRNKILLVGLLLSISVLMFSSVHARGSTPEKAKYAQLVAVDHAVLVADYNFTVLSTDAITAEVVATAKEGKVEQTLHQVRSAIFESRRKQLINAVRLYPPPLK